MSENTTNEIDLALDRAVVSTLMAEITSLKDKLELALKELKQARTDLSTALQHHREDITNIGDWLLESAEEHDLCDEYDEGIGELNVTLHLALPERKKTYSVTVSGEMTIPFTVTVEGMEVLGHHEDIEDTLADMMDDYLPDYVSQMDLDGSSASFGSLTIESYEKE